MSEWLICGLYLLIAGGYGLIDQRRRSRIQRERLEKYQEAAKRHGLRMKSISHPGTVPLHYEARADEITLRIEELFGRNREYPLLILIRFPGPPGFAGVKIRSEAQRPAGAREIEVGDQRFDSLFFIEGPARLLTMLLDAETRRLLAAANAAGRLTIQGGEVQVESFDHQVANLLPTLLALGRRFSEDVDVTQRLAENARQDPTAGVRLRNLLTLVREFPREPGTLETLRAACADSSPQVRLRAAMALGAEGRDVLTELAESLEDDESSARAVAHLSQDLPFDRTRALLDQALRRHRIQTARACLEALGRSGDSAAEPPLLLALRHEETDLRIAAANALARIGSAAAVLPLKEAAEGASPELRRATAEIQSRLQGASPGQLSLAGNEAGQLSLATDAAGQLSLPPKEPGLHGT